MDLYLNKYLRELGINEESWPFKEIRDNYVLMSKHEKYDPNYIMGDDGFVKAEAYDLFTILAMINYSYLRYFREDCEHISIPVSFCDSNGKCDVDGWLSTLDKMINAFKLIIEDDFSTLTEEEQKRMDSIHEGLDLYSKYFLDLWI